MPSTVNARERCAAFRVSVGAVVAVRAGDTDGVVEVVALCEGVPDGVAGLVGAVDDAGVGPLLTAG